MAYVDFEKIAAPANPDANFIRLYNNTSLGKLVAIDESGNTCNVGGMATSDYRLIRVLKLTTTGGATYTPTSGARAAFIECVGGGGAGGGAASSTGGTNNSVGAGGGGGGYSASWITSLASSYSYTVGTGGIVGTAGNNAGGNGVDTTFNTTTIVAKGGTGGSGGGASGTALGGRANGGAGGIAGTGDTTIVGGQGHWGVAFSVVAATGMLSGRGGDAAKSYGLGGAAIQTSGAGVSGQNYGGGGSGGADAATTNRQGGVGAQGIILIWEYI